MQPFYVAVALVWVVWQCTSGDWQAYAEGGSWITFWLGPATVALAVPLAKQLRQMAGVWKAVLAGVAAGSAVSIGSTWLIAWLLKSDPVLMKSLLTKSVTTPITLELTTSIGGIPSLAGLFVALTGMIGAVIARPLLRLAGIDSDWAIGVAVGTSSHAIGTASLMGESQTQVAASSLAMILAGIVTSFYVIPLHP